MAVDFLDNVLADATEERYMEDGGVYTAVIVEDGFFEPYCSNIDNPDKEASLGLWGNVVINLGDDPLDFSQRETLVQKRHYFWLGWIDVNQHPDWEAEDWEKAFLSGEPIKWKSENAGGQVRKVAKAAGVRPVRGRYAYSEIPGTVMNVKMEEEEHWDTSRAASGETQMKIDRFSRYYDDEGNIVRLSMEDIDYVDYSQFDNDAEETTEAPTDEF